MTTETSTPDDDEFSSACIDLTAPASSTPTAAAAPSAERTAPVSPSADAPAPAEAPATAAAAPAEGTPPNASATSEPAPPAAGAEASTPTAAPPAATPSTEAAPAGYVSKEEFAALQAELAALKNASAAPAAEAKPEPPAPPAPLYSAEEQSAIDGYLKEWPDVAKGEALVRRAEYQQLANFMFSQFMPRIEQLERSTSTTVTRNQYKDIVSLVPDYDEVRDATLAWIETQPGFLKAAYQKVAQDGSPQDVAELITRFKKETNYAPAANPGAAGGGHHPPFQTDVRQQSQQPHGRGLHARGASGPRGSARETPQDRDRLGRDV